MSEEETVVYRGIPMHPSWPAKIQEAQQVRTYTIGGQEFPRIKFGYEGEDLFTEHRACGDCGVLKGEYHVPGVCDIEECPCCHGQALGCDCEYEGDED